MSEKTARKYRDDQRLPSQMKTARTYRTRADPFERVWKHVQERLKMEPQLKVKTLFQWLQQTHPGQFPNPRGELSSVTSQNTWLSVGIFCLGLARGVARKSDSGSMLERFPVEYRTASSGVKIRLWNPYAE